MPNERVDAALVNGGHCESLQMARALVMAGRVYLGENKVLKPSEPLTPGRPLSVRAARVPFVSRGGLKLQKALEVFGIEVRGAVCIDVGASTGGFTDVLLQSGAQRVYAVDVGYGQLDWRLRSDARVVVMERTNARFLRPEQFDVRPSFGATDVSFISLKAVLPSALSVLEGEHRRFVALIKPQFEAPQDKVGARGVVRDPQVHKEVIQGIVRFAPTIGWRAQALDFSPIAGPEGNVEFLLDLLPIGCAADEVPEARIDAVTEQAYDKFVKSR